MRRGRSASTDEGNRSSFTQGEEKRSNETHHVSQGKEAITFLLWSVGSWFTQLLALLELRSQPPISISNHAALRRVIVQAIAQSKHQTLAPFLRAGTDVKVLLGRWSALMYAIRDGNESLATQIILISSKFFFRTLSTVAVSIMSVRTSLSILSSLPCFSSLFHLGSIEQRNASNPPSIAFSTSVRRTRREP